MPTENRSSTIEQHDHIEGIIDMVSPPAAHDLARKVREYMDRQACPNAWMVIAYEAVVKNFPAPAPQPHPEPIAWMVGTAIWWTKEEAERNAAATGLPIVGLGPMPTTASTEQRQGEPVAWLAKTLKGSLAGTLGLARYDQRLNPELYDGPFPVFRHADAGEVERVKAKHRKHAAELIASRGLIREERDALRAQLAERDALLDHLRNHMIAKGVLGEFGPELFQILNREVPERAARAALSASAEPSAPVLKRHHDVAMFQRGEAKP